MAVENILLFLEEWRMIMIKSEKWKTIFKSKSLIYIVIAFAVAPVAINLGLMFMVLCQDLVQVKMRFSPS